MTQRQRPAELVEDYGAILRSRKADFVTAETDTPTVSQHGAARIAMAGWPGWPTGLTTVEPVIETFVAGATDVVATSDNVPFVAAWTPLAAWMNATVRSALAGVQVHLDGDAYVTASLTPTDTLEGLAHLDDGLFLPDDSVSIVAIIGELTGPRIAVAPASHGTIRPMTTLAFDDELLNSFASGQVDHCAAEADELVVFPQFGQIHAGPAAHHVADLSPTRQLLVLRAAATLN